MNKSQAKKQLEKSLSLLDRQIARNNKTMSELLKKGEITKSEYDHSLKNKQLKRDTIVKHIKRLN